MTGMQAHAHNELVKAVVRKPVVVMTIDEAQKTTPRPLQPSLTSVIAMR